MRPGRAPKGPGIPKRKQDHIEMQDQFQDEKASKKSDARRRMRKDTDEYYEEVVDLGNQMRALGSGGGDIEQH